MAVENLSLKQNEISTLGKLFYHAPFSVTLG